MTTPEGPRKPGRGRSAEEGEATQVDLPNKPTPLAGRHVTLRPLNPRDYEPLYEIELSTQLGARWRQQGGTPSYEAFVQGLFQGVLAQYMVVETESKNVVGYVSAYNVNFRDQWAYIAAAKFQKDDRSGHILHGTALLINYLFETWPFRKLYAEVAGYNYGAFATGAGQLFEVEGRLTNHTFLEDRWWDLVILALSRETWNRWSGLILGSVVKGEKYQQTGDTVVPTRLWPEDSGTGP